MRIKLIDVDNRLSIKYNQVDGIHNFGDDNAYPSLIKSLIGSSVTAKQCVDINAKYIYGKGFDFVESVADKSQLIINKRGININQLLRITSREFSEQNNIFLHVNYNALFEIVSVDLLHVTDTRIGKTDSTGYSGKYINYNNWDKSKGKKIERKDFNIIDKFNPNPAVIEKQVEAAGGWNKYKGQVLHVTSDFSELYALSDADSCLLHCNAEYNTGVFMNGILENGFIGLKLVLTRPMKDDFERDDFTNTLRNVRGAKETCGIIHMEANENSDDINEQLKIQNIDSNIDDKMFETTEQSSAKNIRKAFGVPSILIEDSDNSIFGQSGELLKQAKLTHWENKEEERNIISEAFQMIFSKFHLPINPSNNWNIIPIIQPQTPVTNE
jgi:hypothetical protein